MRTANCLALSILLAAFAAANAAAQPAPAPAKKPSPEKQELDKISVENRLSQARTARELRKLNSEKAKLQAEKAKLQAEYDLLQQKQKLEIAQLEAELKKLTAENKLAVEKRKSDVTLLQNRIDDLLKNNQLALEQRKADTAALEAEYLKLAAGNKVQAEKEKAEVGALQIEIKRLAGKNALAGEKHKTALQAVREEMEKQRMANDLQKEKLRKLQMRNEAEKQEIDLAGKRLDLKDKNLRFEKAELEHRMAKLKSDLELRSKKEVWKKEANRDPLYPAEPFSDGRLVMSDRRIALNGPIFYGVSDHVTERIHFFNNASSTQPIFIAIDRCPGGSVMEGYRIVKAIETSKAPVHVVVKQFAASMAAVITTMADHSYAYPNAVILHHEMSTVNWGNMTQLGEQLELAKKWEARLHAPVAKKMGLSLEKFRKEMYKHNSDGDWEEFADDAKKLKWVDKIVHEIRETGQLKHPDTVKKPEPKFRWHLEEKRDTSGKRYVNLPRLEPFDFYWIYNPDRYYR